MNEKSTLLLPRLPARLDVAQVAEILGFVPHEVVILINSRLLKPLGRPASNGHKHFWADEIVTLTHDRAWLDRSTRTVAAHWQARNRKTSAQLGLKAKIDGYPEDLRRRSCPMKCSPAAKSSGNGA